MLTIRFDVEDLASVRFAYSPMHEAAFSLRAWAPGTSISIYRPWLEATAVEIESVDWQFLLLMRGNRGWLPDFLTPRPLNSRPDFESELTAIRETPADVVLHDLHGSHGSALPAPIAELMQDPQALTQRIADSFAAYWVAVMAPRWPRMVALLEADITYRAHRIAAGGAAALFEDLNPHIRWLDGKVYLDEPLIEADIEVSGRGLPMMPSIFPSSVTTSIDSDQPPFLTYPVRGRGTLMTERDSAPDPLAALLGRTRASLLAALVEPASTRQLASGYGLTPSAVNQHLVILTANGLLARSRSGHSVLYRRTPLADRLVGGKN
jgi:DNA-binding transcriptional ArsR family regulator